MAVRGATEIEGRQETAKAGFRIGQLSRKTGRSVHTIRWYEAQGLLPGVERDAGGRRFYDERHVDWLELMSRLRRTGMSIAGMREYTRLVKQGRSTLEERRELLSSHRARLAEAIAELTLALKLIDGKIDFYRNWLDTGKRPVVPKSQPHPAVTLKRAQHEARLLSR